MKVNQNCSLKKYNTFGLNVSAKYLIEVTSLVELIEVLKSNLAKEQKVYFLGGGSNILLCNNIDGLVIVNKIEGIQIEDETDKDVTIKAYSGTSWHQLVLYAVAQQWYGIENMSLIPGSVGAAPMQNIGAYGVELKDSFVCLEALNLANLKLETFKHDECAFGYRESVFKRHLKNQYFIYSVTLRLSKNHKINTSYGDIESTLIQQQIDPKNATIKQVSDAVIAIRQSKLPDPNKLGNSGSFFKNPVIKTGHFTQLKEKYPDIKGYEVQDGIKVPAGWLIESLGWKGKRIGNTGSHAKQALVLVNYGNAKGEEVKKLAFDIIKSVENTYQINLEPEVNIWE